MHLRGERGTAVGSLSLFLSTRSLSFFLPFRSYHVSLSLSRERKREYNLARGCLLVSGGGGWLCVWSDGYRENEGELPARKELNYQARRKVQPLKINRLPKVNLNLIPAM